MGRLEGVYIRMNTTDNETYKYPLQLLEYSMNVY